MGAGRREACEVVSRLEGAEFGSWGKGLSWLLGAVNMTSIAFETSICFVAATFIVVCEERNIFGAIL